MDWGSYGYGYAYAYGYGRHCFVFIMVGTRSIVFGFLLKRDIEESEEARSEKSETRFISVSVLLARTVRRSLVGTFVG